MLSTLRNSFRRTRYFLTIDGLLLRNPDIIVFIVDRSLLVLKLIHELPSEHCNNNTVEKVISVINRW